MIQTIKNMPAMQETRLLSLGKEDPLEKGMATHSSILAWRIPWTEEPSRLQSMGSQESDMTATCTLFSQWLYFFSQMEVLRGKGCVILCITSFSARHTVVISQRDQTS